MCITPKGGFFMPKFSNNTSSTEVIKSSESAGLAELVELLSKIDVNSDIAKLNETSISDNNGGRIEL